MEDGQGGNEDDFIFNEYAIDDSLDPLSRLQKYYSSDFSLQRLVLIRELTDTAQYAGYSETVLKLLPLLSNFVSDSEPAVRQMFVQQLHPLAEYVVDNGGEAGYQELLQTFLPFAFELLVDKNVEVGNAAVVALNKLAAMVKPAHVEAQLLNVVNTLAHDERAEDYRVVAAQLYNDLAPNFGEALCSSGVVEEMKILSNDMSFSVRKTVGANLGQLCKVVGRKVSVEKILPIYLSLCKDEIWGVRKACAESIVAVSAGVNDDSRVQQLVPAFKALSEDASRWVRVAAYQNLGQLIHTMRREDISPMFLKIFTDMAFQSEGGDSDFAEYCAFSFPAVVQVIGKERWREVDDAFATLLKDVQWKVRKSLAHSLHEIARIVGPEIAERSLAGAFELLLRDLDEVRFGVIQNVNTFVEVLPPALREKYVPMVCSVPLESENWRLRNLVATKLGLLAALVTPQQTESCIVDLIIKLLEDSVTEVRSSTFHSAALVLQHLSTQDNLEPYNRFLSHITGLATKQAYQGRQMFGYVFQQVVELRNAGNVADALVDKFAALADDPVSNVRFVAARVLANSLANNDSWKNHPKTAAMTKKLSEDAEMDIGTLATSKLPRLADPTRAAAYR